MNFFKKDYRKNYKCLNKKRAPIYFDNACITLKTDEIVEAQVSYYYEHPSCHLRSQHSFAKVTNKKIDAGRNAIHKLINSQKSSEIVFTKNSTESLNIVAQSILRKFNNKILTTNLEHNSNTISWISSKKLLRIEIKPTDEQFDMVSYRQSFIDNKIDFVSVFHISNVTGLCLPIKEMVKIAHDHGALFMLDAAQSILCEKIDVQELDVDFLCFSLHKAYGPSGVGILYIKDKYTSLIDPLLLGGHGVFDVSADASSFSLMPPPDRYEAGLMNYSGLVAVEETVKYINEIGYKKNKEHLIKLNEYLTLKLREIPNLVILGPTNPSLRSGIINFYISNFDMNNLALLLDSSYDIMVRSGVHCAHSWYHQYDLPATLRVSFAIYNTFEECDKFVSALKMIKF